MHKGMMSILNVGALEGATRGGVAQAEGARDGRVWLCGARVELDESGGVCGRGAKVGGRSDVVKGGNGRTECKAMFKLLPFADTKDSLRLSLHRIPRSVL